MLRGERMPENCSVCYEYEDYGMDSYRIHDSLDFIAQLGIRNVKDLEQIDNPYYYEIRSSNKCNLMCRMCTPLYSHLLKKEFEENPDLVTDQQFWRDNYEYSNKLKTIDVKTLTPSIS